MGQQLTLFDYEDMPLKSLEHIIERGLSTFIEVGMALMAIREGQKYKEAGYSDFNVYIEERWGISPSYGKKQLNSGYIANEMGTIVPILPTHESQVRPLFKLGTPGKPKEGLDQPDIWIEAWSNACDLAGIDKDGNPKPPTAKEVEYVVDQMLYIEPPQIPEGKYQVIYADPPWPVGSMVMEKWESPIDDKYPTMTIDDIAALPIEEHAADDCSLFMWTTHTYLPDALAIIEAWGFKYFCCITWNKGSGWTQNGFHKMTEFLLYAYKGKMNIDQYGKAIPTLINENKTYHSKKPDSIRELIKSKTPGPRLELFARALYEGWTAWGNEVMNASANELSLNLSA